jgi:putative PIN family toxin of toxin-antitoxin system
VRAVTPDTDLYVSALIWGGKRAQLLEMAIARKVRLFTSDAIMDEVMEVLGDKCNHSPKRLALEKQYIQRCTVRCVPKVKLSVVKDDPSDGQNSRMRCSFPIRSDHHPRQRPAADEGVSGHRDAQGRRVSASGAGAGPGIQQYARSVRAMTRSIGGSWRIPRIGDRV